MKYFLSTLLLVLLVTSCGQEKKNSETTQADVETTADITYASFGDEIAADNALSAAEMASKYESLKIGDTLNTKVLANVNSVCQAKGCWMRLDLENDEELMVKFKDYAFFMPKNIADKNVIVNGKAYVTEVSVDEQRHYAEDAGKSETEIAAITTPKRTYSFEADGVLLIEE